MVHGLVKTVGIFDRCVVGDGVRAGHREALDDVLVFVHKVGVHVEPASAVEIGDVYDERVALPMAARVSVPCPVVFRMSASVFGNDAEVMHVFEKDGDVFFVLNNPERHDARGLFDVARNAWHVAVRLGVVVRIVEIAIFPDFVGDGKIREGKRSAGAMNVAEPGLAQRFDSHVVVPETLEIRMSVGKARDGARTIRRGGDSLP